MWPRIDVTPIFVNFFCSMATCNNKITLIIIFYLLPEVSHYITDEPTVLKIENLNPISLFINIFYLLPFGILSLSNTK